MLRAARRKGFGIGAFNILDFTSFRAVAEAAQKLDAPVIVQTSGKTVKFWGASTMAAWARQLGQTASVPIAFHLDHGTGLDLVGECIQAGWTSVMFDGSALPFAENLRLTRQVAGMAAAKGVDVEAELGTIGGVEDDLVLSNDSARLADPAKAIEFCASVDLAAFAPAIGTAHGIYKSEPKIAFDRLEKISAAVVVPLALHGGTGLSDEVFARCIRLGCAKVNISTLLKYAFIDGFLKYQQAHPKEYEPIKLIKAQYEGMVAEVVGMIQKFGGAGQAKEIPG
jgi:ketose-bisphosphate aldolase